MLVWLVGVLAAAPLLLNAQQIQVTFPTTRAVFQRNNANAATLRIAGFYTVPITRIEAKVTARDGQGTSTDWRVIEANPGKGVFTNDLPDIKGGWYNLEVRGMNNDQQVGYTIVERVGVGEVFVVSGQSNGQGIETQLKTAPTAGDDRVNYVSATSDKQDTADPGYPEFRQLNQDNINGQPFISPRGYGAWCWGLLGDRLVQRLGVPVLFMNTAWGGTSIGNWRETAAGGITYSIYVNGLPYPQGQPYANLRIALQFYTNLLGVRAVLWHQGEADTYLGTSTDEYVRSLRYVIDKSRQDIGKNLAWVVSRASYEKDGGIPGGKTRSEIINAQNQIIAQGGNVFAGPFTDNIQVPRSRAPYFDETHFDANGLVDLANAWSASLDDNFWNNSQPQAPGGLAGVSIDCAGNNSLGITVNGSYSSILWEGLNENGQVVSLDAGQRLVKGGSNIRYRAKLKDGLGNTSYSAAVRIAAPPAVALSGPATFCEGGTVSLSSSYNANIAWVNQQTNATVSTAQAFTTSTSGSFYVRYRDVSGCDFTSDVQTIRVNPLPAAPAITSDRPATFCQGESTALRTNTTDVQYNWSNGERNQTIEVRQSGNYFLTVTDQNGCTSTRSNGINVVVNNLPQTPVIQASGPTTFCADQRVTLTSTEENTYQWSNGQSSRSITVSQAGGYSLRTRNVFNCLSAPSNEITVNVNPLPDAPVISARGRTTFCDGNQVVLTAASPLNAIWSSGVTTQELTVKTSGTFTARVQDNNGCLSPFSNAIAVDVKPLPATPQLQQTGTYTIDVINNEPNTGYNWRYNTDSLTVKTPSVKANRSGNYSAQAYRVYASDLTCYSAYSSLLPFILIENNQGLSIYPNPSTDKKITIETLTDVKNANIRIYTLAGQEVQLYTVTDFSVRRPFDLSNLRSGFYIIQVQAAGFNVAKRVFLGF
ncbi:hypothetical protein BLX24_22285 [Arsenicibacter rosenii]|uniref:Secretion system C-terminal sorting domain-containing protein n=2 Tax=Arsenicibacter rosenii TaxID=1750698 RepID=A0A1S2VGD7_9BACT|nr:hypothetical protein BLX24_22285 [Arsenicibacter rosenii]